MCPFCEYKIRDSTFCENDEFAAVYNIAPVVTGHSLVIPKRHIRSIMDLSDDDLSRLFLFCRNVVLILERAYKRHAFDWTVQDGEPAGQTVNHLHVHLIPRSIGDLPRPGDWYPRLIDSGDRQRLSPIQLVKTVEYLRRHAKSLRKKERSDGLAP